MLIDFEIVNAYYQSLQKWLTFQNIKTTIHYYKIQIRNNTT